MTAGDPHDDLTGELERFASALAQRGSPFAQMFRGLSAAVAAGDRSACGSYASAIDPNLAARQLTERPGTGWHLVDLIRNLLIFAPIAVTWFGLSTASEAYTRVLEEDPELVTQPFLLLWQQGFNGTTPLTFGRLALIDAALILMVIGLSIVLHTQQDAREDAADARMLAIESEIHVLLARVRMLVPSSTFEPPPAIRPDALVLEALARADDLQARAMERLARPTAAPRTSALAVGAVAVGALALVVAGASFAVGRQAPSEFTLQAAAHARQLEVDLQRLHRDALTERPAAVPTANLAAAANTVDQWAATRLEAQSISPDDRPLAVRLREAARATRDAAEAILSWSPAAEDRPPRSVLAKILEAERQLEDVRLAAGAR